jgi:hypothetical protein
MVAYIARAFLSIGLLERDRNFVKLLWFRDNDPTKDIVAYRYTTVVFGNTSSPFSLGIVLEHHLEKYTMSEVGADMDRKLYMDNLVTGVDNDNQAVNYYYTARGIMRNGGFNLRQWLSNSVDLSRITELEGTKTKGTSTSVLGMLWNAEIDMLSFQMKSLLPVYTAKVTKRSVLSGACSVFDPIGLVAPVIVRARMFISDLWRKEYDWDDELPVDKVDSWRSIASELEVISDIEFPRSYGLDPERPVQLHAFCDASLSALGAVVFLRQGNCVSLVGSKSKIVNQNAKVKTTIPQLELSAMVLCTKYVSVDNLVKVFLTDYPELSLNYWTDSEISLFWLNYDKQLKRPSSTKVNAIKDKYDVRNWRHVA